MSISLLFPVVTEHNAEVTANGVCLASGVSQGGEVNFHCDDALNKTLQLLFSQAVGPDDHCRALPAEIVCSTLENKQECYRKVKSKHCLLLVVTPKYFRNQILKSFLVCPRE